jgi:hypothetical protein
LRPSITAAVSLLLLLLVNSLAGSIPAVII